MSDISTTHQQRTTSRIPHIDVSVTVGDDTITHHGAQFIDAIGFLVHAEEAIRRNSGLKEPVDISTEAIQKENMRKLMEGLKGETKR